MTVNVLGSWFRKPPKYSKGYVVFFFFFFNWRCGESGANDEGENRRSHLSETV